MSTTLAPEPTAPTQAAAATTKKFRVTVTLVPAVLAQLPPIYVNLLLGTNQSPNATALLSNFVFAGGPVTKHWMNSGARGDFSSSIQMQCRAGSPAPQAIGAVARTAQRFQFDVAITTNCSTNDSFSLWLLDQVANWLPSTAVERPGLFATVNWTTTGQFTCAAYQGNGSIDGQSDLGFGATIEAL